MPIDPRHAAQYKSYLNKCSPTSCKEKKTQHHTQASHYNSVKNCHYNSVKIAITEHTQHSNTVQHSNSHNTNTRKLSHSDTVFNYCNSVSPKPSYDIAMSNYNHNSHCF